MLATEAWAGAAEAAAAPRSAGPAPGAGAAAAGTPSSTRRPSPSTRPSGSTAREAAAGRARRPRPRPHRRRRVQPVRGRRLGGAGRLVRVPVADDAAGRGHGARRGGGRARAGRSSTWARGPGDLAAAAAALGADTVGIDVAPSMVRRAAIAHPSIPFRVGSFEAHPGGRGRVRRGRRQLRVQPRRAAGGRARGGAAGPAPRRLAGAVDLGRAAAQPAARADAGRGRGGRRAAAARAPAGPTNFRTDAELRELFESMPGSPTSASRTSSSRRPLPSRTSCGTASSTRRCGSRRWSRSRRPRSRRGSAPRSTGWSSGPSPARRVARDPGRGPGHPGRRP